MPRRALPLLAVLVAAAGGRAAAQPISTTRVASGSNQPTFATSASGTFYVIERGGTIRTLNTATGTFAEAPFLNLANVPGANFLSAGGEQGLLGLAFHPNFQSNGYFYVDYTTGTDAGAVRVDRFTYNFATGAVDVNSRLTLLEIPKPTPVHNGGWLGFGPNDGYLYISTGDGGYDYDPQNNAQNTGALLGKILRIDVNSTSPGLNYAVPASNPFVNTPGARGEVWAYGLRNPWRPSFDRATGDLYIADVGQATREEVNVQKANSPGGANYGWKVFEGNVYWGPAVPPNYVPPVFDYGHDIGEAIVGGYVYRGNLLDDDGTPLDGTYFFGDLNGRLWSFRYDRQNRIVMDYRDRTAELRDAVNGGSIGNITSFAEDGFGNLYVLDLQGNIFELQGTHAVPEPSSLALAGVAALGLWLRHRRRTDPAAG
jgi:glucose/arabinose dehydrogenase